MSTRQLVQLVCSRMSPSVRPPASVLLTSLPADAFSVILLIKHQGGSCSLLSSSCGTATTLLINRMRQISRTPRPPPLQFTWHQIQFFFFFLPKLPLNLMCLQSLVPVCSKFYIVDGINFPVDILLMPDDIMSHATDILPPRYGFTHRSQCIPVTSKVTLMVIPSASPVAEQPNCTQPVSSS